MTVTIPLSKIQFSFDVLGTPRPQGSKKHIGNGRMVEMSKGLPAWRKAVVEAIHAEMNTGRPWVKFEDAVMLEAHFYVPRPASAKNRRYPHLNGPGDLDKLVRAICDAITISGLWKDDSQVCKLRIDEDYADERNPVGAYIAVIPL